MSRMTEAIHMPSTPLAGDAAACVGILAWAQKAGLEVAAVTVGTCRVELRAPAPAPVAARDDRDDPAEETARHQEAIYRKFGGPVFEHATSDIPPGELQPAIGRNT